MKKLLFLLSIIALAACVEKAPVNESTLSGTVLNNPSEFLLLTMGRETDTLLLGEGGSFTITKELDKPADLYIRLERSYVPIYLAPGKDLQVTFDKDALDESITYEGGLALENQFNQKEMAASRESSAGMRDLYTAGPEDYLAGVKEMSEKENQLLDDFIVENPGMDMTFIKTKKLEYEFSYYSSLMNYEPAHKYYAKVEEVEMPSDWFDFLKEVEVDNDEYLNIPICLNVVSSIIDKNAKIENNIDADAYGTIELLTAKFKWVIENIKSENLVNHFLNTFLGGHIDSGGSVGAEGVIKTFYEKSTKAEDIEAMIAKVEEWAPINPGMPAPGFTLPDINGDNVSLSDFLGKYVYIDFWATWCGPCKIEIPFLEKMAEDYKDKNIEIVSISVDKDKQAWVDMVTADKPQWLQLHDSIMMNDDYLVKFIPTFVLIDMEGKIINPRALRPSSGEELEELLNSLEGI